MADSKNIDGRGPYEAIGRVIRKLPVETKFDGVTKFELGFPVCEVSEALDEEGAKTVALLMNRGDVFEELLQCLQTVRANLIRLAWEENTLMIEGIDAALAKAGGRS